MSNGLGLGLGSSQKIVYYNELLNVMGGLLYVVTSDGEESELLESRKHFGYFLCLYCCTLTHE